MPLLALSAVCNTDTGLSVLTKQLHQEAFIFLVSIYSGLLPHEKATVSKAIASVP